MRIYYCLTQYTDPGRYGIQRIIDSVEMDLKDFEQNTPKMKQVYSRYYEVISRQSGYTTLVLAKNEPNEKFLDIKE